MSVLRKAEDTVITKGDSLKTVIVVAALRPRMKGDTLEYNVSGVVMQPNAEVQDLLRRLPGMHIDPDGTISYNGEKIKRLLVDGVDIFASDPTMLTGNFDANKIARVQILGQKSEAATMTGIDDGTRTKTLNLVLKANAKDGYFGNVEAGGDVGGYYKVNGTLAAFRGKEQFTVLGLASNTGIVSFSSGNNVAQESGLLSESADALAAKAGTGIPRVVAGVVHYANSWGGSLDQLSVNVQGGYFTTQPNTVTRSLQTLPDSTYGQNQLTQSTNRQVQNSIYGSYDWASNRRMKFKMIFGGSKSSGQNQFMSAANSYFNDTLVNRNDQAIRDNVDDQKMEGNLWWRMDIGKNGNGALSFGLGAEKGENNTSGYLYSTSQFYQGNGLLLSKDTADERKIIAGHSLNVGTSLNLTIPTWMGPILGLSYGTYFTRDKPSQVTYARGNGEYQQLIDSLSGYFSGYTVGESVSVGVQGRYKAVEYTLGAAWLDYVERQRNLMADSASRLNYNSIAPRVMVNYTSESSANIRFSYSTALIEPAITQLTPITNNNDPLHIMLGNRNLAPEYRHNFRLEFHHMKDWLLNVGLNMSVSKGSISTKVITDSLGRQISQPVNVNGGRTAAINFSLNKRILGLDIGLQSQGSYTRTVSYINSTLANNDAYLGGGGFSLSKFVADRYSVQVSANLTYFDQVSGVNVSAPVHYWAQSDQGMVAIYLIPNFEVGSNGIYTWQQKTSAFSSGTSVFIWNGYISRNFLHNKLVAKFKFNNILNANAGISRTNSSNINTQSSTNILGQYWIVSVAYHFDKKFKK